MSRYKKIAYITPFHQKDMGHISRYFILHSDHFYLFAYPQSYKTRPTVYQHYKDGVLVEEMQRWRYKGSNKFMTHFFYYYDYLYFLFRFRVWNATILCSYPLFLISNIVSRLFLRNTYVLWLFDYFPNTKGFMAAHNALIRYYNSRLRYVLYLAPKIQEIYATRLRKNQIHKQVQFGLETHTLNRKPQKNVIGYIGTLSESKGISLLLETALKNPELQIEIIGEGIALPQLQQYVEKNNLSHRVVFHGFVSADDLPTRTSHWSIAAALYGETDTTCIQYTYPGKIAMYIELGLPIMMTYVSAVSDDLTQHNAGVITQYNTESVMSAITKIQNNPDAYAKGIARMQNINSFETHYKSSFAFLEHQGE